MKVLFFGDIVGKAGRRAMAEILPQLKEKYQPDAILANVENLAHGKGVTTKTLNEMNELDIDCFTSGNHIWKKEGVDIAIKESGSLLITPANDPRTPKERGYCELKIGLNKLFVINLLGRVYIDEEDLRCPFREIDEILKDRKLADGPIIVDLHAEATSEKIALGWYLDGRVSALLGTHTHIPTADYKILPQGTAYVTDVGMIGPVDSVLGVEKETIIKKFLTDSPIVFKIPEKGEIEVNAIYLEIEDKSGLVSNIEKVYQTVLI